MFKVKYYLVEAGPLYDICNNFRKAHLEASDKISAYVESLGSSLYQVSMSGNLLAIHLPEIHSRAKAPEGFKKWHKPQWYAPKVKSEYKKVFESHTLPNPIKYVNTYLNCPVWLEYSLKEGGFGSRCIANPCKPISVHFYSEVSELLLVIPDVHHYIQDIKRFHPEAVFEDSADKWTFKRKGTKEISKEDWQLLVARYRKAQT
jgi:hypothetical protein